MGLGPVADFTLEEARERARKARQQLRDGIDPIDARRAQLAERAAEAATAAAKSVTFRTCAQQYFDFHSPKWKNRKHAAQFLSTMEMYVFPVFGNRPVQTVDKTMVLKAIEPIWYSKTETASRVRGRVEAVLDYAQVRGYRAGENPAAWDGNLKHLLPAPSSVAKVEHHAALAFSDVAKFMTELSGRQGMAARALEFLVLTAARTGEVTGARWSEIDLVANTWTVPAARMKAKRDHRVPLTPRVIELLKQLPTESDFVFPGSRPNTSLSNMAMAELLKRMERSDITVHGFRSTFRDWAAERTSYPNHVVEMALAHTIGNQVEAAYRRGDLFEKRATLMADWSDFATEIGIVKPPERERV